MGVPFDTGQEGAAGGLATAAGTFFGGPVGGALAGSLVSGLFNRSSAKSQMKFQERMASTQYQRAAKDLEAAGLNRVLALGSPAASPGGAGFSVPDLGASLSSGRQAGTAEKGQKSLASLQEASVHSAMASARAADAQARSTNAQAAITEGITEAAISKAQSEATSADKNATRDQMINEALQKAYPFLTQGLDSVSKILSGAKDAASSVSTKFQDLMDSFKSSAKDAKLSPLQYMLDSLGVTGQGKARAADEEWERKRRKAEEEFEDQQARKRAREKDKQL